MKRCLLFTLVLSFISAVAVAETPEKVRLVYKFQPGETYRQEMVMNMDMKVQGQTIKQTITQVIENKVGEVSPDGTASLKMTITRMHGKMEGIQAGEFDSNEFDKATGPFKTLAGTFKGIVGGASDITISARGESKLIKVSEGLERATKGVAGGMLSGDTLKQLTETSSLVFPDEGVSPKQSWKQEQAMNSPLGKIKIVRSYTAVGPTDEGLYKFDLKVETEVEGGPKLPGAKVEFDDGIGHILFDQRRGRLAYLEVTQPVSVSVGPNVIEQEVKTVLKLLDDEPQPTK